MRVYVALGSNLNDPLAQVKKAIRELAALAQTVLLAQSSLYQTKPVGYLAQPDFINAIVKLETTLTPEDLLGELYKIEQQHGRRRDNNRNAPRTLDLDILLYDDIQMSSEHLTIPHPRLTERAFVLYPLAEIAPDLILPDKKSLQDCFKNITKENIIIVGKTPI